MKIIKLVSTMNGVHINDPNSLNSIFINQGEKCLLNENWHNINTHGLSNSRNYAISLLKDNEIGIISDNDVILHPDYENKIINAIKHYPDADILTFKTKNKNGTDFNNYANKAFKHNLLTIMKVCSIEIVIRKSTNIPMFDTKYGLGSNTIVGEENIFLSDAIKSGLNVYFFPEYLSTHHDDSHTGNDFSLKRSRDRKLVFCRIYGKTLGKIIFLLFQIKNIKNIISSRHLENR